MAVSAYVAEPVFSLGWRDFLLLCGLRDGWELLAGVKPGQLPAPGGYMHHVLLDAGLAAASVLCQVIFQAAVLVRHFLHSSSHSLFFRAALLLPGSRAVCSPPQQTPAASQGCCGPWTGKKASNYFCSGLIFFCLPDFCLCLRKIVHKCTSEIFT